MNIRHARSWAVASLLLSGALVGCSKGQTVNGIYYAPSGTTPTGIEIVRQQPAGLALALEKNPHASSWPGQNSGPTTQAEDHELWLPAEPLALILDQLPKKTHPDPEETPVLAQPLDDRFGSRNLSKLKAPADEEQSAAAPATQSTTGATNIEAAPSGVATTEAASPTAVATTMPIAAAAEPEAPRGPTLAYNQTLIVDLATGKAVFTDTDGRKYPLSTNESDLEFFRNTAKSSSWRSGELWSREILPNGQFLYTASAMSGKDPIKDNVRWLAPSPQQLPNTIKKMHDVFELQQRKVHPLSETIDLLK